MGTINHDVVIATTCFSEEIERVTKWLFNQDEITKDMFTISTPKTNGYVTVFCGPDGSKEGWEESDTGDKIRHAFLEFIHAHDTSSLWRWVTVSYGEYGQRILSGNNESCYE